MNLKESIHFIMRFFYYNLGSILVTMIEMKSNSNNINYYDKSSLTDDESTLLGKVVVSTRNIQIAFIHSKIMAFIFLLHKIKKLTQTV